MKFGIRIFGVICSCFLILGWFLRYQTLNNYFSSSFSCPRIDYKIGETVDLGSNIISSNAAPGYSITVLNSEIIAYEDFINTLAKGDSPTINNPPDYVMDITIRLYNTNSTAPGVFFPDFLLHSYDMYTDPNLELLSLANPILENGSYGLSLKDETYYIVHLIYNLRQEHLSPYAYQHLEDHPFFLRLTTYPTRQEVRLQ